MRTTHLLVVDWDFFFPRVDAPTHRYAGLYDWAHAETDLFIHGLWPIRAGGFLRHNLALPTTSFDYREFWTRFRIATDATLYVAESNADAVQPAVADRVSGQVWLYDAHHDCGYRHPDSVLRGPEQGRWTCEDWLIFYGWQLGTRHLHQRYPTHRHAAFTDEPGPFFPDLDRAFDTVRNGPRVQFDTVFVCRSGAWVPPWSDPQFDEFCDLCPAAHRIDLTPTPPRPFDLDTARALITTAD